MFLSSVAPNELSLTSCGLRTPLELPKEANSVGITEVPLDFRGLSKQNNLETTSPEWQTKRAVHSNRENQSTLHHTSEKITEISASETECESLHMVSQCILSASFRNRTLLKVMKLGPITYVAPYR